MRSPGKLLRAVLLGMSWVAANAVRAEPPRFTPVAPGIDYAIFDQRPEDIEPARIHAFKIDLEVAEVRLVSAGGPASRRIVAQIAAPYPVVVAVNASFFDTEGRAIGLGVNDGQLLSAGKWQSWGALVVDGKQARIVLVPLYPRPLYVTKTPLSFVLGVRRRRHASPLIPQRTQG